MNKPQKRRALGRGLANLIPEKSVEDGEGNGVVDVDVNAINPNPFQPRTAFDEEEIAGLAESIEAQGLLQPIMVRKKIDGYQIVTGERRFRAVQKLGWDKIPAIVRKKISDREMLEITLVENVQREDLNELETAFAYQRLLAECNLSHEDLSKRVGKSRSFITNYLRLLKLPAAIQLLLRKGEISMGHARALLTIEDGNRQKELARRIVDDKLTVRDIEELASQHKGGGPGTIKAGVKTKTSLKTQDPDLVHLIEQLQYKFGTSVKIYTTAVHSGKIEIRFTGTEDLNRVVSLLMP